MRLKTLRQPEPPIIECIWLNTNDNIEYIREDGEWIPLHGTHHHHHCFDGSFGSSNNQNVNIDLSEIKEELSKKIDKSTADNIYQPKGDFLTKNDIDGKLPDINQYLLKVDAERKYQPKGDYLTEHQSLEDYAKKDEIPSLDPYATKDFVTNAINEAQINGGEGDVDIDLSIYALKDECDIKYQPKGDYITKDESDAKYQPKGDYATRDEINNISFDDKLTCVPTVSVGGIKENVLINGKPIKDVLYDMLCPFIPPTISSKSASKTLLLYGKTYDNILLSATAKKGSEQLKSLTINGTKTDLNNNKNSASETLSITPLDTSLSSISYDVSVEDIKGNKVDDKIKIDLVGGVFIFFSSASSLSEGMKLDFTANNCQSERKIPDGSYEVTNNSEAYLYIVVPTTMNVNVVRSSNIDVPMQLQSDSLSMKQGSGNHFVDLNFKVYRNEGEKIQPKTYKFVINPKDN